ncbi:MAG: molecular chaperone HtpG [Eubacteriales bacterium]|nr:molecular chaperone HtpG [Eubacteriales bacterium]MDY2601524.1 molecular chaperone HtpG [Eubacteriales bacterium]
MPEKSNISINAKNIMPVIKKWLYSDRDIFVRELVSNCCDAVSKMKRLVSIGEAENTEEYRVDVLINRQEGTLTFRDNGLGMTADEVKKYIAQVAFSGAEDFLSKYKNEKDDAGGIIGHFGLGFYSAFMVAKKVVIDTLSYQKDAQAARWISEDGMEYEMEPSDRATRGTTITLYLNDEDKEFLEMWKLTEVLEKYCGFMPVPVFVQDVTPVEKKEPAEGEEKPEEEDKPAEPRQINDVSPLWLKKPSEVTDEEYKAFYHKVFHDYDEPLFWIHLNAEYPFNLKGILYFPRLKNEFTANEGVIKLYNNQVFVADNIKEVIPEFLMLLKGAIDCPDLPLNVSRSFLQNDGYVKKMAAYITRKVADRLVSEFNNHREDYQKYWDDIHPFVKYGCIKDEKFYDRVKNALLFKTTAGDYLTLEEYRNANCEEGKDPVVYYTSDEKRQAQMIEMYTAQNKGVVVLNTLIDANFISFLEFTERESKLTFKRVDAAAEDLTETGETSEDDRKTLETLFREASGDDNLEVQLKAFKSDEMISMITVDEQNRRFTEMSRQWGRDLNLPEKRTLVLNDRHPIVQWLKHAPEGDTRKAVCAQVVDLAEMARQPLVAERMVEFLRRSNQLLSLVVR